MSTNIEELQEKIFGTFQSNYKYIKTILKKSKEKNKTRKSFELSGIEKKKNPKTTNQTAKAQFLNNDNSRNNPNTNLLSSKTSINKVQNGSGSTHHHLVNYKGPVNFGPNYPSNVSSSKDLLLINNQKNPPATAILKTVKEGNINIQINKKSNSNLLLKTNTQMSKNQPILSNDINSKNKKSFFTKLNGGGLVLNHMNSKEKKLKK
jgi:hypothetical protein